MSSSEGVNMIESEEDILDNVETQAATESGAQLLVECATPVAVATTERGKAILAQAPAMREAVVKTGESTALVDFAVTLVGLTPEKEALGVLILELMQQNLNATPPQNPNDIDLQAPMDQGIFLNDEFQEWFFAIGLDELHPASNLLFGNNDANFDDDVSGSSDDENLDEDLELDEDFPDEVKLVGPEVPELHSAQDQSEATPRLASRIRTAAEEGPVIDTTHYRERSRSPINDEDGRD